MSKRTAALTALLLLAVLLPARPAPAQAHYLLSSLRFGLHMAENNLFEARFILKLKQEIGLGPEQEQRIENLMLAYEEGAIRRGSDLKVLELKFASLLKGERIDRREVEKMAREIGRQRTDVQVGHLLYLLDVRDVLSREQVQKLEDIKKNFRSHRRPLRRDAGQPAPEPPAG